MMVLLLVLLPISSVAQTSTCDANGVVFGFFNGVQTKQDQALIALGRHIKGRNLYGSSTPNGEPITYDLFYNDTEGFADFVETFDQRLHEHGGLLAGRFELFFSATRGEGAWWRAITSAIPSLVGFLDSLFDLSRAALMTELTANLGNPNMAEVASRHRARIDHWASLEKKMLFFAHSQGNLFVNMAYAHALSKTDAKSVRVVHVAPASPILSGPHTLADKDLVINGLRIVGAVVPNTTDIPPYFNRPAGLNGLRDLIGHGLLEIYLNPAVPTAGRIREHVLTALRELESPPRQPMPPFPDFVAHPWTGGSAPVVVRTPDDASHVLEKVVDQSSAATVFVSAGGGYWSLAPPEESKSGWSRKLFQGKGMGGSRQCLWGEQHVEGWASAQPTFECVFERVPLGYGSYGPALPEELAAYKDAPRGTVVRLNTMTYLSLRLGVVGVSATDASVGFMSGAILRGFTGMQGERVWNESYTIKPGVLQNQEAYESWLAAQRAHATEEFRRYERYLEERAEYEERRRLCPPPPPPPPPDPEACVPTQQVVCPS
ncbi:hypothetical protein [Hydrogenophaga sp. ANAO-22]|uniref:hypothetical protein n=1 Tax=Hydrogenophaga sp. ANAO-22 TaxID=3166645 RepID=UPI0036D2B93A